MEEKSRNLTVEQRKQIIHLNGLTNNELSQRKSIRLQGYDYSKAGLYFITICVQNHKCLFGEIKPSIGENISSHIQLIEAGKMIEKWYYELENKFIDIQCHEMIVMPNHFHCIIENTGDASCVGGDLHVCQHISDKTDKNIKINHNRESNNIDSQGKQTIIVENGNTGEHTGSPLHRVVQWFKTMTTNDYIHGVKSLGWIPFDGKLWQRNYYEHIIRNEKSYNQISEYIINNPEKWQDDKYYIK